MLNADITQSILGTCGSLSLIISSNHASWCLFLYLTPSSIIGALTFETLWLLFDQKNVAEVTLHDFRDDITRDLAASTWISLEPLDKKSNTLRLPCSEEAKVAMWRSHIREREGKQEGGRERDVQIDLSYSTYPIQRARHVRQMPSPVKPSDDSSPFHHLTTTSRETLSK